MISNTSSKWLGHGRCSSRGWSWCRCTWVYWQRKWPGKYLDSLAIKHTYGFLHYFFFFFFWSVDQVRFELTFFSLNPELKVVAPWREWEIQGREDAIEYAKKHNVPVPVTKKSIYSRDRNLWHLSHEVKKNKSHIHSLLYTNFDTYVLVSDTEHLYCWKGDILEDPANEPKKDMYMMSVDPEDAPDQPE